MSQNHYLSDEDDLERLMPQPDFTGLSRYEENRIIRAGESFRVDGMIRNARIAEQAKVTATGLLCQGRLDEAISQLIERNPRPAAVENLEAIGRANAIFLGGLIFDDDWR